MLCRAQVNGHGGRRRTACSCPALDRSPRRLVANTDLQPLLACADRRMALEQDAESAAGVDRGSNLAALQYLQVLVLVARDDRAACRPLRQTRRTAAAGRPSPRRTFPARARPHGLPVAAQAAVVRGWVALPRHRPAAALGSAAQSDAGARHCGQDLSRVDSAPPGSRRQLGRNPTAVGLQLAGAARGRLPAQPSRNGQGAWRAR